MTTQLEDHQIAHRYAKALFEEACTAAENGTEALELVRNDLCEFENLLNKLSELSELFLNPGVPRQEKQQWLHTQLGSVMHPLVLSLLDLMLQNHRMTAFSALVVEFQRLYDEREQILHADVITAVEMDATLEERLHLVLKEQFGSRQVILHKQVDPAILGGVILKVQDYILDGSYAGKLEALRQKAV
jgi:F-type H+-transporting ATPase subunit delta